MSKSTAALSSGVLASKKRIATDRVSRSSCNKEVIGYLIKSHTFRNLLLTYKNTLMPCWSCNSPPSHTKCSFSIKFTNTMLCNVVVAVLHYKLKGFLAKLQYMQLKNPTIMESRSKNVVCSAHIRKTGLLSRWSSNLMPYTGSTIDGALS